MLDVCGGLHSIGTAVLFRRSHQRATEQQSKVVGFLGFPGFLGQGPPVKPGNLDDVMLAI